MILVRIFPFQQVMHTPGGHDVFEIAKLLCGLAFSLSIPFIYTSGIIGTFYHGLQQLQEQHKSRIHDAGLRPSPTMVLPGAWPSSFAEPDMSLINELLESIERSPPGIEARRLLIEQYLAAGWTEAAKDTADELLRLDPTQKDVKDLFTQTATSGSSTADADSSKKKGRSLKQADDALANSVPAPKAAVVEDSTEAKSLLVRGYQALLARAKLLQRDARLLRDLEKKGGKPVRCDKYVSTLDDLADGRISSLLRVRPPSSARAAAAQIEASPDQAMDVAMTDLEDMLRWLRSPSNPSPAADNDAAREAISKRVRQICACLPEKMQWEVEAAFMHLEHETLQVRNYVNDETMYGDAIPDIPRSNFWVSEDAYAWDMDELVAAIKSNGGVMRNPLSKQLFTPADIKAIIRHPLGNGLQAMQVEQSKLSQGVRPETIEHLESMSKVLLVDMTSDQLVSRKAVDDFLAYVATLPESEQKSIELLKVPAKDSHTGQPYDATIGEWVSDAAGNRVCFHKAGDYFRQAADHLRKNKN